MKKAWEERTRSDERNMLLNSADFICYELEENTDTKTQLQIFENPSSSLFPL